MSAPSPKSDSTTVSASLDANEFRQANAAAATAGAEIARSFAKASRRQRRAIVREFRAQLLPPGPRGRRDTERITRAYQDWLAGVRGIPLFEKHIPRWKRMGYYERDHKRHRLMSAINKRRRKEEKARAKAQAVAATESEAVSATKSEAV